MNIEKKRCSKCERDLPLDCFNRNKSCTGGRGGYCKECKKEYNKNYRNRLFEENPAKELLWQSCQNAFKRGRKHYVKNGYEHVRCSYPSANRLFSALWSDKKLRADWEKQTDIYLKSNDRRDRPSIDRVNAELGYRKTNMRMLPLAENLSKKTSR